MTPEAKARNSSASLFAMGVCVLAVGAFSRPSRISSHMAVTSPSNKAPCSMRSIDIWRVENDLFVEHWDELNTLEIFQQMGAIPQQQGGAR
jgi:hypothetical protein